MTTEEDMRQKKDILMVSYRPISGYSSKMYTLKSGDKLIIISGEDKDFEGLSLQRRESSLYKKARELMEQVRQEAKTSLTTSISRVIIYSGFCAQLESLRFARDIKETYGITPELVVCEHDLEKKQEFAKSIDSLITLSECGGTETMGLIADEILRS